MRNLDLFSLSLFVAICETRSISRAAERMNIVASAASRRVGLLEHEAGLPLLTRRPHGVEPTSAGLIVLRYARDVMHLGQKVEAELDDHRSGASGTIRVYASSSVLVECLAADLAAFAKEQPAIKIDLEERPSADTLEALYRKQADVGVVVAGSDTDGLATHSYAHDVLAVAMPFDHDLAGRSEVRFDELFDDDHIALEPGTAVHRLLADQSRAHGRGPRVRVQVRSFEVMCQLIGQGLGIGILPRRAIGPLATALGLSLVPLAEPWAERRFIICVQEAEAPNASTARLIAFLRDRATQHTRAHG
ncbi:LysR family transcriptional regulator [Jiella endophytica]|uniref:LysR family transcriptional regulator n=1 Tax=Jiella endophytica TaxID=2558362 RepID=A0A4Y8RH55_9HYPH|nr:LysR family transcriptional regulator [Jiella endophytica]TFF22039.1 LysR family transcriptional regulator [Jiella endophytica]